MVEGARLESVYTLTRIEGSNPSLSAIIKKAPLGAFLIIGHIGIEASILDKRGSTKRQDGVLDAGFAGARRERDMDGPNQSLSLRQTVWSLSRVSAGQGQRHKNSATYVQ